MIIRRVDADRVIFRHAPWRTVQDFVRESGAEGGINFSFFFRGSSHPHNSRPLGSVLVDGEHVRDSWWDPTALWHALVRHKNGSLDIIRSPMTWHDHESLKATIDWMAGGGPIVLLDGEVGILDERDFPGLAGIRPHSRVERVGIGLTADQGKALFVYEPSATAREMGQIMKDLGCERAMLGDGGSSASIKTKDHQEGSQLVPNFVGWLPDAPQEEGNDHMKGIPLVKIKSLLEEALGLLEGHEVG